MELTERQKRELIDEGYTRLPGLVPEALVDAAVKAINCSLGQGTTELDDPRVHEYSCCPDLMASPVIMAMMDRTPLRSLCDGLLGPGNLRPFDGSQIALRFPTLEEPPPKPRPHIDGMGGPSRKYPGPVSNFTGLAMVLLSDLPRPDMGNFTVWPGSHSRFESYFREHGPDTFVSKGLPPVEIGEPVQVLGRKGDVLLAHWQLAHHYSPNTSPNIRYAVFFRLYHMDRDKAWRERRELWRPETLTDIWLEWPGLRSALTQPRD
jgi:hypothetical protein